MDSILAKINALRASFSRRSRWRMQVKRKGNDAPQKSHDQMTAHDDPGSSPLDLNLNEIRLLRIHAATMDDDDHRVQIDLQKFTLEESPSYVALSYAWGKARHTNKVRVNGRETTVRRNLHDFLLTASQDESLSGEVDWLWIDQLCIDQSNVRERGHQVARMSQIFTQAKKVIIWLGRSYDGSDALMTSLQDFEYAGQGKLATRHWPAWDRLTQLDYWNRLWVVQEILLAQHITVMLGSQSIDWNSLSRCSARYSHVDSLVSPGSERPSRLHTIRAYCGSTRIPMQWSEALGISKGSICQNEHDRIFGLLGLVPSGHRIQPSYDDPLAYIYCKAIVCHREDLRRADTTHDFGTQSMEELIRGITGNGLHPLDSFDDFRKIVNSEALSHSKFISQGKRAEFSGEDSTQNGMHLKTH